MKRHGLRLNGNLQVRKIYDELSSKGPVLIVSNHLGYLDPIFFLWAIGVPWRGFLNYKSIPWIPASHDVVVRNPLYILATYIGKTLPVYREQSLAASAALIKTCVSQIESGHSLLLFVEGSRSRTGFLERENLKKGAAHVAVRSGLQQILCIYVRAKKSGFNKFPIKNDIIHLHAETLNISEISLDSKIKVVQEMTAQIGRKLQTMEDEYFRVIN